MKKEILIVDIETTGLSPRSGFIVEVGIVALDLETGECKVVFDSVCREEGMTIKDREAWIFLNTDLSVDEVRDAQDFTKIRPDIQTIIDAYPLGVTAYNRAFDFSFLESRGVRINAKLPCPMELSAPVVGLPSAHPSHGKYKWPKVEEAWAYFFPHENYVELHRGADDAKHEALIVYELYKRNLYSVDL